MRFISLFLFCLCIISTAVFAQAPIASATSAPPASAASTTANNVQPTAQASNIASSIPQPSGNQTLAGNGTAIVSGNSTVPVVSGGGQNNNSLAGLPTSASYGNSVYPGTGSFIQPTPSKSVSPLYRIASNENVTFVWQFTNLLVRPQNLTLAAVAPNSVTYTISALAGDATSAVWQIGSVPAASPLMMGNYQVQLYDQRGPTAIAQPGWLMPITKLTIAFYSAESYQVPTGSGYCPTCFYNAASRRVSESLGPILTALGVATITSSMIIYGLLY